jgi:pimeloyl-ACP methyl ester carboxylesterase
MIQIIQGTSSATTIVFLHGYLLSNELWFEMNLKRAPWRTVLLELPYHELNTNIELEERNLAAYAEFVHTTLLSEGIKRYSLVGHSMGGYIGLLLLELDQNLDKLILLHSNIWEDSPERKKNRERVAKVVQRSKIGFLKEAIPLLFRDKEKHQNQIHHIVKRASQMHAEGIIHGALSMRDRKESFHIVEENKERCFFIQGSHDALIPRNEAQLVWGIVAYPANFFLIPNCGHMSPLERPRALKNLIGNIITETKDFNR